MDNNTEVSIKFKNSVTGQKKLEQYAATLKQVHSFLGAIDTNKSKEIDKNTRTTTTNSSKLAKNFNTAFEVGKISLFANQFKRLVQTSTQLIKRSAEYTENVNLLSVAFYQEGKNIKETTKEAMKYVNTLSEMYGLDESKIIRTTGLFKQMANSLGITNKAGTDLAQTLTQLSIDAASLFNAEEVEDAAKVFQSALASQTKPVRGFTGADITQQTLQVTLDTYGIDRAITDLSYAEKRLVIVASLVDQLEQATNDFGKTIESPANQMKIFTEQVHRLGRALGNVLIPIFAKVIPYINAFVMVLVELVNMVANFVAKLFGYDFEQINPFSSFDEGVVNLGDNMDETGEKAKKLKNGLRGFDKLNVISSPSTGSGGGGGIGKGAVDPKIYDLLNQAVEKYNKKLERTTMLATTIRNRIMEWLGFVEKTDEEGNHLGFTFQKITSGTVLGALAVGGVIYTGVSKIVKLLSTIGLMKFTGLSGLTKLGTGGASFGLIAGAVAILGASLYDLYKTNDKFATSVNEKWTEIQTTISPIIDNIKKLFQNLGSTFKLVGPMFENIYSIVQTLGAVLLESLYPVINDALLPALNFVLTVLNNLIEIINQLWNEYGVPITEWLIQAIEDVGKIFNQLWVEILEPIITNVIDKLTTLWTNHLAPFFQKVGEVVGEIIQLILVLWDNVLQPVISWLIKTLGPVIETVVNFVVNIVDTAIGFIMGIINSILDVLKGVIKFISGVFSGDWKKAWDGIKDIFKGVGNALISIFESVVNFIIDLVNLLIKAIYNGVKSLINGVLSTVENVADYFGFDVDLTISAKAPQIPKISIPRLKVGMDFVPSDNFPAYLDYGERVLTKQENEDYNRGIIRGENAVSGSPVNATFVIQVGSETIATKVLNDLQEMAKSNGQPIQIGA